MYECNDKMVSHPDHYQAETGMEVIDVIESFTFDLKGIEAVDTGNALKYLCRWKKKNGLQDLKKARWYLEHLIDHVEKLEEENKSIKEPIRSGRYPWGGKFKLPEDPKGREIKITSRWKCNRCDKLFEIDNDDEIMYTLGSHMEEMHHNDPKRFAIDFTQLEPNFIYLEKEND